MKVRIAALVSFMGGPKNCFLLFKPIEKSSFYLNFKPSRDQFRKLFIVFGTALIILISGSLFAQSTATVEYLQNLSKTEIATVGDAVKLFSLQSGKGYQNFDSSSSSLKQEGILPDKQYSEQDSLNRGLLAFMVTRYLRLTDSLWFNLFESERYAYNACASAKIMPEGKSEWDKMSGPDLIEMLGKISERTEGEE